jgi:hypothetical protein
MKKEAGMFTAQQVTGPVAPGQYSPAQVSAPSSYYPAQTDQLGGMFAMMMPMIMMVMMFAMITPMLKGVTAKE